MKLNNYQRIALSILSGLILSLGWMQLSIGWIVLIGFIPLLFVFDSLLISESKRKKAAFFLYSFICFLVWNLINTWWIYHATLPGAIAAVLLSSVLMASVMMAFFSISISFGRRMSYIALVSFWISFEYLFMNSQLSWPWLILGNAFANNVKIIQWYEYFGHIGGSLWTLIVNLLAFEIIRFVIMRIPKTVIRKYSAILAIVVIVPIVFSIVKYNRYKETANPVDIVIVQPNIDSYEEKFVTPVMDQMQNIINLAESLADENVDFFVAPETAIPNGMWEDEMHENYSILMIKDFLADFPDAAFVIGADTRLGYYEGQGKSKTARPIGNSSHYYDLFNTALQIDNSNEIQIYHKSKLVPGVEMLPYPKLFWWLEDLMLDLGGMSGSHGTQEERTVFIHKDIKVGVPICYESVYGEFVGEWVSNGANLLFVITNDGWWEDTPGYRQHHSYSRIRAIETRRSIARSANTGISSFINQRGDIIEYLGWNERGAIRQQLNANDKITFYVKYGDFFARMSLVFSVILLVVQLLNFIIRKIKQKDIKTAE